MRRPETIFKYDSFSLQSIRNLKAQSVYFASPSEFNDPYDCAINANVQAPNYKDIEEIKNYYLNNPSLPDQVRREFDTMPQEELSSRLTRIAQNLIDDYRATFLERNGVSCFSEINDNLLMWSHYGGQHRGFCAEFRTDHEPFNKIRPVEYTDTFPKLDLVDLICERNFDCFIDLVCVKSKSWAYEREWRGLHKEAGTLFTYEASALKAIYFGSEMPEQDRDLICLIMSGQNPEVELYLGSIEENEFKIVFERFPYVTLAEAKRLGLT